jgi:hypothetical protein
METLYASVWSNEMPLRKAINNSPPLAMETTKVFPHSSIAAFEDALNMLAANYGPGQMFPTPDFSNVSLDPSREGSDNYDFYMNQAVINFQRTAKIDRWPAVIDDGVAGFFTLNAMDDYLVDVDKMNAPNDPRTPSLPPASELPNVPYVYSGPDFPG